MRGVKRKLVPDGLPEMNLGGLQPSRHQKYDKEAKRRRDINRTRLIIDVSDETLRRVRMYCAAMDITYKDFFEMVATEHLDKHERNTR